MIPADGAIEVDPPVAQEPRIERDADQPVLGVVVHLELGDSALRARGRVVHRDGAVSLDAEHAGGGRATGRRARPRARWARRTPLRAGRPAGTATARERVRWRRRPTPATSSRV